jgi:hypothetical protein
MRSLPLRLAPAVVAVALLAGCPDSVGQTCDPGSTSVGNFTLTLSLQPSAQQCVVYDGGVPAPLPDGGSQFGSIATLAATLCEGNTDGGKLLHLKIPNQVTRDSDLDANGGISFATTSNTNVTQTPCGCSVDYTETITGILVPAGDAGIAISPDGGLTASVAAIDGSVVDNVVQSAGASNCFCHLPCDLHYQMSGTPTQ